MIDEDAIKAGASEIIGFLLVTEIDRAQAEIPAGKTDDEQKKDCGRDHGSEQITFFSLTTGEKEHRWRKPDVSSKRENKSAENKLETGMIAERPNHLGKASEHDAASHRTHATPIQIR